jgi:hypothetical protein
MQALNYAAMVSRFSLDALADAFASSRYGEELTSEQALTMLQDWAPTISDETLGVPRIVLLATEFGPTVTNLALFLYENHIRLKRVQPYRTADGRYIVTCSQILPVPNAEDFMIRPRSGTQTRATNRGSTVEWDWERGAPVCQPCRKGSRRGEHAFGKRSRVADPLKWILIQRALRAGEPRADSRVHLDRPTDGRASPSLSPVPGQTSV